MSPCLLGYSMLVCVLGVCHLTHAMTSSEYLQLREEVLLKEKQRMIGGQITLTPDEQMVNQILMKVVEVDYVLIFTVSSLLCTFCVRRSLNIWPRIFVLVVILMSLDTT